MLSRRFKNDGRAILHLNELQKNTKKQIEEKIRKGVYSFEEVPCYFCGKEDFETLSEKDRYGLYHSVVICRNCGLIQQNPQMTQESCNQFYEVEYRKLYGGGISTEEFFRNQHRRGAEIYNYLKTNLNTNLINLKIFEVGTGAGGFLQYFREKNNEAFGIDLGPEYINFGKNKYNLNLKIGTIANVKMPWIPDIVIYSHVLEHILNPIEEFIALKPLMSKDSYLYIELPGVRTFHKNYEMNFLKCLQNAHVYYFTLTTLKNLLRKADYDFVCGDEFIHSIFKPSSKVHTDYKFVNDYEETISFLKKMERLRYLPIPINIKIFIKKILRKIHLYKFAVNLYYKVKS